MTLSVRWADLEPRPSKAEDFSSGALTSVAPAAPAAPAAPTLPEPDPPVSWTPSAADVVTLASYALGVWWALGGPTWAGLASIVGDELDGRLARATGTASPRGSALDWGQDVALTPLVLLRAGRAVGRPLTALAFAPPLLYAQATLRADGFRPPVGSARAAIMIATMLLESKSVGT